MPALSDQHRVAFVAHGLLNQNSCPGGLAVAPGAIVPVVRALRGLGLDLVQLPCPETSHLGVGRWWQTREMYDTPAFREHCGRLGRSVLRQIEDFRSHGYHVVVVGIDGSPTDGVHRTESDPTWGGRPGSDGSVTRRVVPGRGVWMEVLLDEFRAAGLAVPPAVDARLTEDVEGDVTALCRALLDSQQTAPVEPVRAAPDGEHLPFVNPRRPAGGGPGRRVVRRGAA
ncbi:MAG TPA: hypothetical protein VGC67_10855 [Cellulomonas sp.]